MRDQIDNSLAGKKYNGGLIGIKTPRRYKTNGGRSIFGKCIHQSCDNYMKIAWYPDGVCSRCERHIYRMHPTKSVHRSPRKQ